MRYLCLVILVGLFLTGCEDSNLQDISTEEGRDAKWEAYQDHLRASEQKVSDAETAYAEANQSLVSSMAKAVSFLDGVSNDLEKDQ